MKTAFSFSVVLVATFTTMHYRGDPLLAAPDELTLADLLDLPADEYKVDPYLQAARSLQIMGMKKAFGMLRELAAKEHWLDNRTLVLCRMLFKAKPGGSFRQRLISSYWLGGDTVHWPLEPIALVDGVPFLVGRGGVGTGLPEFPPAYLEYCIKKCDWNDFEFKEKSKEQKRAALKNLMSSPELKGRLQDDDRKFLEEQINSVGRAGVKELATFETVGPVLSLAFSLDGKTFASVAPFPPTGHSNHSEVRLWDVQTGKERYTALGMLEETVVALAFTPDSKALALGIGDETGRGAVKLWDLAKDQELAFLKEEGPVTSLAIAGDGQTLAAAHSIDKDRVSEIALWDLTRKTKRLSYQVKNGRVNSLAFTPDGKTLILGTVNKTVELFDMATGKVRSILKGHAEAVTQVAISPDGRTLASASQDKTVRLWDMTTGKQRLILDGHTGGVWGLAFSTDSKMLASGGGTDGETKVKWWGRARAAGEVKIWDIASGNELASLKSHWGPVLSLAFKVNGKTLASGGADLRIILWDLTRLQARRSER